MPKAHKGNVAAVEILTAKGQFIVFRELRDNVCLLVAVSGDMSGRAGNALPSTIASMGSWPRLAEQGYGAGFLWCLLRVPAGHRRREQPRREAVISTATASPSPTP
jgi:hypothetical protein